MPPNPKMYGVPSQKGVAGVSGYPYPNTYGQQQGFAQPGFAQGQQAFPQGQQGFVQQPGLAQQTGPAFVGGAATGAVGAAAASSRKVLSFSLRLLFFSLRLSLRAHFFLVSERFCFSPACFFS